MKTIPILVMVRSDGIDVNPTYVNVKNDSEDVKLKWTVIGATFPTSGCFAWKNSPSGAPTVSCPSSAGQNVIESATYVNNAGSQRVWQYSVTIVVNGSNVTIDPEVNNEPPNP